MIGTTSVISAENPFQLKHVRYYRVGRQLPRILRSLNSKKRKFTDFKLLN